MWHRWTPEEIEILRAVYPLGGPLATMERLTEIGAEHDMVKIMRKADLARSRPPWTEEEDDIIMQAWLMGKPAFDIDKLLGQAGYHRRVGEILKRQRELGLLTLTTGQCNNVLLWGGEYRPLTDSTAKLIRRWHAEGDAPENLAKELKRPLWLVLAIIPGEPWEKRWEQEGQEGPAPDDTIRRLREMTGRAGDRVTQAWLIDNQGVELGPVLMQRRSW